MNEIVEMLFVLQEVEFVFLELQLDVIDYTELTRQDFQL